MRKPSFSDRLIIFAVSTMLALPLAGLSSQTAPAKQMEWRGTNSTLVRTVALASAGQGDQGGQQDNISQDDISQDDISQDAASKNGCKARKSHVNGIFCDY